MAAAAASAPSDKPHIPVLLRALLKAVAPVTGTWLDGTFGAGGYTRGLLEAGAERVIAVDRDPLAFEMAADWAGAYGDRLAMQPGVFSRLDEYGSDLDGVVLDLGVSSMQLDRAERGFSFIKDGPLDMRMSQDGPSAADLVNTEDEARLAAILFHYGEERASRRIAKAIVRERAQALGVDEFSHSLDTLIGGQMRAGLHLIDMYEDRWPGADLAIDALTPLYIATLAQKPA